MITKSIVATMIVAAGTYGGVEAIDSIKPQTELVVAQTTIENVLRNAQYLEQLGKDKEEALSISIRETPDAEGIKVDGYTVIYEVYDTCLAGYLGEEYKKIITLC